MLIVTLLKFVVAIVAPPKILVPPLNTTRFEPATNAPLLVKFPRIFSVEGAVSDPVPLMVIPLKLVVAIVVPLMTQAPATTSVPLL